MQKHTKILLCLALGLTPILTSFAHAQTDLARADFDGNQKVDIQDFLAFAAAFGKTSSEEGFDSRMDFNGDNTVNIQDFLAFAAVFGQSVELKDLSAPTQERLELQKKRVIEIVTAFHQVPEAQRFGITIWGIADPDTWLIQAGRSQGRPEWPLLFDDHLQPKPAYDGFVEALQNKGF